MTSMVQPQMQSCTSSSGSSFQYNNTLCFCNPGYIYNTTTRNCSLFQVRAEDWLVMDSGVEYSITFPETIFSFDSIKKFTQSQAVFLEATVVILLSWLFFCFFVRFGSLGDGRTPWFKIRWWISRLDISFATRHWLDDQKPVVKRKTELGGTFSIASWILFIGLLAALLYQIISKRAIEVHNVRATSAPDLTNFVNDMEFNITTISTMSCSHLRGPSTLVTGSPGFIDHRTAPLSTFANYSCLNTTNGPTISLKCNNCQLLRDNAYISWQFVDLPNNPATAVGFQFKFSANNHGNKKHLSFVSGTLKNGSNLDDKPMTYRGRDPNILKFNIFPRIYHNLHDLKLIQPLFHEFLPGSSFSDVSQLRASLQRPTDGLINTTLYINFLTYYIVEIDNQNILGPVSFLADLGGLYCISIGIFFYFLVQCEYRIKKFRNEDSIMRNIRNRRKAKDRWNKLRKYVTYTWGCSSLQDEYKNVGREACCTGIMIDPYHKKDSSSRRGRRKNPNSAISFNQKVNLQSEKEAITGGINTQEVEPCFRNSASITEGRSSCSRSEKVLECVVLGDLKDGKQEHTNNDSHVGDASQPEEAFRTPNDLTLPPPPLLEGRSGSEMSVKDMEKNLEKLFEYNVMLREKLVIAQSMLHSLTTKAPNSAVEIDS
ncbi:hypothetical protein LguiA_022069 [Lonicera macranthoides]